MEGPKIYYTIPIFGGIPITETIVNMWIVMVLIFILCKILTHNMKKVPKGKQVLAEMYVKMMDNLVEQTMGKDKMAFAPYIAALFIFSLFSSLLSLFSLRPPTADLNVTMGWALITFALIQYNRFRTKKLKGYLKNFVEPVPVMLPLNIISEIANPISLGFRHFGNIAAGLVITSLLYGALASLSTALLGISIPILQVGLPGVLSLYFDLFTSFLQAFIFSMLTMVFVAMAMD